MPRAKKGHHKVPNLKKTTGLCTSSRRCYSLVGSLRGTVGGVIKGLGGPSKGILGSSRSILQTARVDYQKALLGHYGPPVRH